MKRASIGVEFLVGLLLLIGATALFFLAMKASNFALLENDETGYIIQARFDNIGGLKVKAPVTLAGVKIGKIDSIQIDPQTFEAVVSMRIHDDYNQIPEDSFAKILTAGLLGEQYIGLDPGGSDMLLVDGSEISITQSAMIIEEVISRFLFSQAEKSEIKDTEGDAF